MSLFLHEKREYVNKMYIGIYVMIFEILGTHASSVNKLLIIGEDYQKIEFIFLKVSIDIKGPSLH